MPEVFSNQCLHRCLPQTAPAILRISTPIPETYASSFVLASPGQSCIISLGGKTNARLAGFARHVERDFRSGSARGGEDPAADTGLLLSGDLPSGFRQARVGPTQPLRPGGAAFAFQHRA